MKYKYKDIKVGDKLKNARLSCGLTQEQVSEQLDCSTRYICQLETNKLQGSINTILTLCSLYGITTNDVYSDYLTVDANITILGYKKLNQEHRYIIDHTIEFLNKLQNNKK